MSSEVFSDDPSQLNILRIKREILSEHNLFDKIEYRLVIIYTDSNLKGFGGEIW